VAMTVEDIAEAICLGREHVSRLMSELESTGTIRRARGWILISSAAAVCEHVRIGLVS
jgi:CRP-like cAMP-binding protein